MNKYVIETQNCWYIKSNQGTQPKSPHFLVRDYLEILLSFSTLFCPNLFVISNLSFYNLLLSSFLVNIVCKSIEHLNFKQKKINYSENFSRVWTKRKRISPLATFQDCFLYFSFIKTHPLYLLCYRVLTSC